MVARTGSSLSLPLLQVCATLCSVLKIEGVSGAALPSSILLILGLSTLIADALSMSVSDYVSTVADNEVEEAERSAKMKEFMEQPTAFAQELMTIYLAKGN